MFIRDRLLCYSQNNRHIEDVNRKHNRKTVRRGANRIDIGKFTFSSPCRQTEGRHDFEDAPNGPVMSCDDLGTLEVVFLKLPHLQLIKFHWRFRDVVTFTRDLVNLPCESGPRNLGSFSMF